MTSRLRALLSVIITGLIICLPPVAYAGPGNNGHALSAKIVEAHMAGMLFQEVSLFSAITGNKHTALLTKETLLQPLTRQISGLYQSHPQAISLSLRSDDGKEYKLEMLRSHPTSEAANIGYIDAAGRHKIAYNEGLHYQGSVAGCDQSLAAMSVFANGDVMLLFANGDGNFVLGKLEDGSGKYILYNDQDMRSRPYAPCGVSDNSYTENEGHGIAEKNAAAYECRKVKVYWEVVYNIYSSKGSSLVNTQNYITGLFNQFQVMYRNENVAMELKSMYVWTVQDDYPTSGSSPALNRFKGYWNSIGDGFDGDIAHLLTRDNAGNGGGNGGLAYVDVLCNRGAAYAYSDIYGYFNSVPTWSWDVEVITHETGHNLGSKHTHWCGWNTGTAGACGSIDNCTTQETGSSCTTCSSTFSNSAPTATWKGTVMSYCHLVARGINLANGFGPLPGAFIRSKVSSGACLDGIISAKLSPAPICNSDGAISLVYATNNFGTAPYTYNWSSGAQTQSLANITTPGNYSVQITDSNGCRATYAADVIHRPSPGEGIAPFQQMPICCNAGQVPLPIRATVPQSLADCQSVYWLRSSMPISDYATAVAFFDTAQAANILPSTNSSTSNIRSTGAALNVFPPSCAAPFTEYYTPVAVQLPHTADSFIYSVAATTTNPYQAFSTTIGGYITLVDQTTQPSSCDLLDTPASQSLLITVSGYTGRANNMRLIIQDAAGNVLYQLFGRAGDGSYAIPPASISGSLLQALQISAFDYNCTTTTCVAAQASLSAARTVSYAARNMTLSPGCTVGASIRVDYAQTNCTKLEVGNTGITQAAPAMLYPNPASKSATLKFTATGSSATQLKVTDMLGKTIFMQEAVYSAGQHQQVIDVHAWAKGVYFVNFSSGQSATERLKLVVE